MPWLGCLSHFIHILGPENMFLVILLTVWFVKSFQDFIFTHQSFLFLLYILFKLFNLFLIEVLLKLKLFEFPKQFIVFMLRLPFLFDKLLLHFILIELIFSQLRPHLTQVLFQLFNSFFILRQNLSLHFPMFFDLLLQFIVIFPQSGILLLSLMVFFLQTLQWIHKLFNLLFIILFLVLSL